MVLAMVVDVVDVVVEWWSGDDGWMDVVVWGGNLQGKES